MDDSFSGAREGGEDQWTPGHTSFEQECLTKIESMPEQVDVLEKDRLLYESRIWNHFQNAAVSVVQLFTNARSERDSPLVWDKFQAASLNLSYLYKGSIDFQNKLGDVLQQIGHHKRNKEIATWAKKKKGFIRRDELLAFLADRSTPTTPSYQHIFRNYRVLCNEEGHIPPASSELNDSAGDLTVSGPSPNEENDLEAFRQVVSMSSLNNGLQSRRNNNSPKGFGVVGPVDVVGPVSVPADPAATPNITEFIDQEFRRHDRKKRNYPTDVSMESPSPYGCNKRVKF